MANDGLRIAGRRTQAWWEPSYDPHLESKLTLHEWKFNDSTGPRNSFLSSKSLSKICLDGQVQKFVNLTFEGCDLQGSFEHRPAIVFKDCRFYNCDFAYSDWYRVAFSKCIFKKCSFALTTFDDCEFRDCEWEEIGLQGSKTDFNRTFLNNPTEFINAGFSGSKGNHSNPRRHAAYQSFRLEETKAQVARTLLHSHKEVGDDKTYYENARLHDTQELRAKIFSSFYQLRYGASWFERARGFKVIPHILELALLNFLGLTNAWGATLLRPVVGLTSIFIFFGLLYGNFETLGTESDPWKRSFDITMIAGYTNYSGMNTNLYISIVQAIHLVLSIVMYTVFFSTAISRNSRSRS